mgnify:CR=1 FL=1
MGFLKKIIKPFKKLSSFTGKVVKGAASGGLVGAAAAFVKNVGPGNKNKNKKKLDAKNLYKNGVPSGGAKGSSSSVRFQNDRFVTT